MQQLQRSINHWATAFAGRYKDFLFPTRHNHSLRYVNKNAWLSMDLSAAAAAVCSATQKLCSRGEIPLLNAKAKLNLWRSDSSHLIHFVYFGWRCIFFFFQFCVPPSSETAGGKLGKPLFSLCIAKEVAGEELSLLPQERNRSCDSTRIKTQKEQYESKSLWGGSFLLFGTPIVLALARKTHEQC